MLQRHFKSFLILEFYVVFRHVLSLRLQVLMFVFAFVHSQKKEPVGNDDHIPENAQNLDELTVDILAVSNAPQSCLDYSLKYTVSSLFFSHSFFLYLWTGKGINSIVFLLCSLVTWISCMIIFRV